MSRTFDECLRRGRPKPERHLVEQVDAVVEGHRDHQVFRDEPRLGDQTHPLHDSHLVMRRFFAENQRWAGSQAANASASRVSSGASISVTSHRVGGLVRPRP